jgi:TrmH family RNA methyltransferase
MLLLISGLACASQKSISNSRLLQKAAFCSFSSSSTRAYQQWQQRSVLLSNHCIRSSTPSYPCHAACKPPRLLLRMSSSSVSNDSSLLENVISSTKSNTVKRIQALLTKPKKRLEQGQMVVEGPRMVFDLIQNPKTRHLVRQVLVSTEQYTNYAPLLLQQQEQEEEGLLLQLATPEVLKACSDTVNPQGIVAIVDIPSFSLASKPQYPLYLVLDGVSDPGNVGTLLRSSLAVGVAGVLLLPECCDVWNPKCVRSAMGASFQIPIFESQSWRDAMALMESWGVNDIYAATMMTSEDGDGEEHVSQPHFEIDWLCQPTALVIGGEGNGLSAEIRKDLVSNESGSRNRLKAVHVPMQVGIESLNAAVCGSVILFEYLRQCQTTQR